MKRFIIIVSVYDEANTQAYPLGGIFDSLANAKNFIVEHVESVLSNHWTKGRLIGEEGYKRGFNFQGDFHAQDIYSGQSLEITIYELPVISNYFDVCCVSKEDVEERGFDTSNLEDDDMERIASKMDELILEGVDYWYAVDGACEYCEVPRKE